MPRSSLALALLRAAAAWWNAACSRGADDACIGKDLFGDNFDCGGADWLYEGEKCWADGPAGPGYSTENGGPDHLGGLRCVPGTFCHPTRGCQPLIPSGSGCDELPTDLLWGMCADAYTFCYSADPEGSDSTPGPRLCRPLPTTGGAFCDATLKPDCDDYAETAGSGYAWSYHPEHAWEETGEFKNRPAWGNDFYTGAHLYPFTNPAFDRYPAIRLSKLICRNNRCVKPPAPGEPCADIGQAPNYAARGPLRFSCAQPDAFTVERGSLGGGFGGRYDFSQAVYCIEGRCTPASELEPDTCFAPDGAAAPLDPVWCSTPAQSCVGGGSSCLSPCRSDGTCGMCRVCVNEDGTRDRIEGSGDCPEQGNPWKLTSDLLVADYSDGDRCGYSLEHTFAPPGPVTGELWLTFGGRAAVSVPGAAFDIFINGVLLERWQPGAESDCLPSGTWEPPTYFERRIDASVAAAGPVQVTFRGTPELCTSCRESCIEGTNCRGNELVITLENRTRDDLGLVRDDTVCQPR